jgi:chemotaxis protein MotC
VTKLARIIVMLGFALLWVPAPCVANEAAAEEEAAPAHGESEAKGEEEASTEAKSGEEAKSEAGGAEQVRPLPELTPEEAAKQPFGLVRTLRSVQDQIAQGSASAHEFQKRFLAELNTEMRNMPSETWDDPRNARAAVIFVLSGGDPRLANDLLSRTPLPPVDERLLKAALAFGEGRAQDAVQFFEDINVRSLEPGLAGLVALIYGTLIGKKEAKKAIALFDDARLMSPGTLVEESALRQEVLLVAREGDFEKFDRLASQYSRRFGKSIYARNFRRQFFAGVARQDFNGTSEWISRTEAELMKLPQAERGGAYLSIAEEATLAGNVTIASFAAGKAAEYAREGSAEKERAHLYEGAARLVGEDYEAGIKALNGIAKQKLRPADKEIHGAALSLASQLRKWPEAPAESAEPIPAGVARAQDLMSKVDTLLAGGAQ